MPFIKSTLLIIIAFLAFVACGEVPLGGSISLNKSDASAEVNAKSDILKEEMGSEERVCNCIHRPMTLEEPPIVEGSNK